MPFHQTLKSIASKILKRKTLSQRSNGPKTIESSAFPHFPNLPPELRIQIWRHALSEKDPALYPYKAGCLSPLYALESDEKSDPHCNVHVNICRDLLDYTQFDVPLIFVSREARHVALTWIREQGCEMRFREDKQCHVFVRPFDLICDVLYIWPSDFENIFFDLDTRMKESRFTKKNACVCLDLKHIAVSEVVLQRDDDALLEIYNLFRELELLFIVTDARRTLGPENRTTDRRRPLKLRNTPDRALTWNRDRQCFRWKDITDGKLYVEINEACQGLVDKLIEDKRSFEIRPVYTTR